MLHLLQKTEQIKISSDLVNAVCLWVDNKRNVCSTPIIGFDTYQKMSLKSATRNKRYSKPNPTTLQYYIINEYFAPINESTAGPQENHTILDRTTNDSIERSFITQRFSIWSCRNFITYYSTYREITNNQEEGDTLFTHCKSFSKLDGKRVCVYAKDVDVAVLLIAHRSLLSCCRL